ncbi:MAG: PKD domain-containing protein [Chitinophagales bacterium]|nr:PKD domain-containing protein [Chitinophagales bacterium]MDW8418467.1 PKD domain-containing protein [Chitinophagales bacterium]
MRSYLITAMLHCASFIYVNPCQAQLLNPSFETWYSDPPCYKPTSWNATCQVLPIPIIDSLKPTDTFPALTDGIYAARFRNSAPYFEGPGPASLSQTFPYKIYMDTLHFDYKLLNYLAGANLKLLINNVAIWSIPPTAIGVLNHASIPLQLHPTTNNINLIFEIQPTYLPFMSYGYIDVAIDNIRFTPEKSCEAYFNLQVYQPHTGYFLGQNLSIGNGLSYHWTFGDGNSSNLPYPVHIYNTPGNYTICLTVSDTLGCVSTYCDSTFYLNNPTDSNISQLVILPDSFQVPVMVHETLDANPTSILVYPNPADSYVTISVNNHTVERIVMMDANGAILGSVEGQGANQLDIRHLQAGIYFLEIKLTSQHTQSHPVIYRAKFVKHVY